MLYSRRNITATAVGLLIGWLVLLVPLSGGAQTDSTVGPEESRQGVRVLAVVGRNYGANTFLYLNNFELLGWDVTLAGLTASVAPCPFYAKGIGCPSLAPDILISDSTDISEYDVLAIMPASGKSPSPYSDLMASDNMLRILEQANERGMIITGQCYSARLFSAADILTGKTVLTTDRYQTLVETAGGEFAGSPHPPHASGNLVTAVNGLYYNTEYMDAVAAAIQPLLFPAVQDDELHSVPAELSLTEPVTTTDGLLVATLGGLYADGARDVCRASDGGLYIVGYTYSFGSGAVDALVIKTDAAGIPEWTRALGGASRDEANAVIALPDGGCVVAGLTTSVGEGATDILIARFAADGTLTWARSYGGRDTEIAKSICDAQDGGFVVTGYVEQTGETMSDILLLKFGASGDCLWAQTFGERDRPERGHHVIQTQSGGFLISGTIGLDPPDRQILLIKTTSTGVQQWEHPTGYVAFDSAHAAVEMPGGGFIMVGQDTLPDENLMRSTVFRTSSTGTVEWRKEYGRRNNFDVGEDVCRLDDGTYAAVGVTDSLGNNEDEAWIRIIGSEGTSLKLLSYDEAGSEWFTGVCSLPDNGFAAVGHTDSTGAGSFDVLLVLGSSDE